MSKRVTVCGLKISVTEARRYGGGHVAPVRDLGTTARVSKAMARRLAEATGVRLPRMGWEVTLCDKVYLENVSGMFSITKRASGGLSGARRRRGPR